MTSAGVAWHAVLPLVALFQMLAVGPGGDRSLPVHAGPPPSVEQVRVEARLEAEGGRVDVTMQYRLQPSGASEVPLLGVEFAPARLTSIRAFLDPVAGAAIAEESGRGDAPGGASFADAGRELDVQIDRAHAPRLDVRVLLPESVVHREQVSLTIRYVVENGVRGGDADRSAQIPMAVVKWPPRSSREEMFLATVHLVAPARIHGAFPADFERLDPADGDVAGAVRFSLPVVPSMLRFTASSAGGPFLTFERGVDLIAVALLVGFAAAGWRVFRRALA